MHYRLNATYVEKFFCNMQALFNSKITRKGLTGKIININVKTAKAGLYMVQATCNVKTNKLGFCNVRP